MSWLIDPTVVANDVQVGGVETTQVHSGVDVVTMVKQILAALSTHPSALGITVSGTPGISHMRITIPAADLRQLSAIHPTIDIYSGNDDHTLRKLVLNLSVPVSGAISQELGGITGAQIQLSMEIDSLNQPQTITVPTNLQPFSAFRANLHSIISGITSLFGGNVGSLFGSGSSSSSASSGSSAGTQTGSTVTRYSRCVTRAGTDAARLARCTRLLGAG